MSRGCFGGGEGVRADNSSFGSLDVHALGSSIQSQILFFPEIFEKN